LGKKTLLIPLYIKPRKGKIQGDKKMMKKKLGVHDEGK